MTPKRLVSLSKSALLHAVGLACIKSSDTLLASFPRSGSTYLRTLLANVHICANNYSSSIDLVNLDNETLVLGYSSIKDYSTCDIRLIKTHRHRHHLKISPTRNAILLLRDPLDVMKSAYRYYSASTIYRVDVDFDQFVKNHSFGIHAWTRHTLSWTGDRSLKMTIIDYSKLNSQPVETLNQVLSIVNLNEYMKFSVEAVEKCTLEKMQKIELSYGYRNDERFVSGFNSIGGANDTKRDERLSDVSAKLIEDARLLFEKLTRDMQCK